MEIPKEFKKEISRVRSELRKTSKEIKKESNPFTGVVSNNYWTATGMPWINSEGRKAVLTEWFWQPIRGQPRRVDTNELRQFSQTFWVHSCVTTICDEMTAMDWDVKPTDETQYDSLKDDIMKVKNWLTYPNKNGESFALIMRALIKDILELDAGVLVKVFDLNSYNFDELEPKSGAPTLKPMGQRTMLELYARDGASFLKEVDKFGFAQGYWQYSYQIPAHPMWFNRDEIVYIMRNQRSMSTYGYAPTQAIMDIVKSLHYSTLYNKRFFEENSIPDGVLSILETNENEMQNFVDNWTRQFQGQPHKFAVVNKDIKWNPLTISQRELEFLETQKWYYQIVIGAFGLTPSELGLTEDLNRSTSSTQAELSRRKGIRPLMKVIEHYINKEIIPEFAVEGIKFEFTYDDPSEKAQRLANWQIELSMGVKTPNEIRNEMGLNPIEGGDNMQSAYGSMQEVEGTEGETSGETKAKDESQRGYKNEETPKTEKSLKSREQMFADEKAEHPELSDEIINQIVSDHMKKGVDDGQYYREQTFRQPPVPDQPQNEDYIQSKKKPKKINENKDEIDVITATPDSEAVTIPNWEAKELNLTTKEYTGIDLGKSWTEAEEYIDTSAYRTRVSKYFDDLSEKEVQGIIECLRRGLEDDQSLSSVTKSIDLIIKDKKRAETIARTEMMHISSEASLIRLDKSGIDHVKWVSSPHDGRLCEECNKRDGKIYTIKSSRGMIPHHPNCRCSFAPHV